MSVKLEYIKAICFGRAFCILCLLNLQAPNAAWRSSGGPEGGNISTIIAVDSILIAGVAPGGIYRSTDFGESWQFVGSGTRARFITGIDTLGSILIASANAGGMQKYALSFSYDKGATWSENKHIWPFMGIESFTVHDNSIFVNVQQGVLYRSDDTAKTWVSLEKNVPGGLFLSVGEFVSHGDTLFATTGGGMMLTTNNGNSWSDITGNLRADLPVTALVMNNHILLAGTLNAIYQFDSDKNNWSSIQSFSREHITSINIDSIYWHIGFYQGNVRIYNAVTHSWLISNDDNEFRYQPINCFCRIDNKLLVGTYSGIFSSKETNNWVSASRGIYCQSISDFASTKGHLFTSVLGAGVFVNGTVTEWQNVNNSLLPNSFIKCISFLADKPVVGTIPYTLNDKGGIYFLEGLPQSTRWDLLPAYLNESCSTCIKYIRALATNTDTLFIGGGGGFFISSDSGKTISKVAGSDMIIDVNCLYNDSLSDNLMIGSNQGVFKYKTSTNEMSNQLLGHLTYAISGNKKSLFAGAWRQGLLRSDNNGETWTKTSLQLPTNVPVVSLACIGDSIFAGSDGHGVFFSNNNGDTWQELNDGLTCPLVKALHIHDRKLYAGTNGGSVFEMPLAGSNSLLNPSKHINSSHIKVIPNRNSVNIYIQKNSNRKLSLTIMDIAGRIIYNKTVQGNQDISLKLPIATNVYIVQIMGQSVDYRNRFISIK